MMRFVAIVLAVAAYAVAAVAPAGAHEQAEQASFCDPLSAPDRTLRAGPAGAILGRGGEIREPELGQVHRDLPAAARGKAGKLLAASVPVYFHVVTDGATGAVTDEQIAAEVAVLNTTFSGGEGGVDTGFTFQLAGVTRTDDAGWFSASPGGTDEDTMKQTLRQGGANALNLYSTSAGAYLGWSYLPDILTQPGQAYLDGVVFDWETIPGASTTYAGSFDQGNTATHEVGHWLNLEHTFFGGCTGTGDFVDDTPPEQVPTSGCPEGKDSCSEPGTDPIHNYMDYSFDSCYTEFTAGQAQRMGDAWLLYRAAG